MTSVAGVFFAFYYNNLFPEQVFHISRSIELILAPIIGGIGTLFGPILGAFVLTGLSEARDRVAACARLRLARRQAGVLRHLPAGRRDGAAGRHLAVARAAARAGAPAMSALLSIAGVSKRFRGLVAVDQRELRGAARRDLRRDRAERRRQDHAVQHDRGRVRAGRGRDRVSAASASTGCGRTRSAAAASAARSRSCGRSRRSPSRTTSSSARCCARPTSTRARADARTT